jgi:hypothetical protein
VNGEYAQRSVVAEPAPVEPDLAGITRLDFVCSPHLGPTAQALARRWGEDRALPARAVDRIATLVAAAVGHGLRFGPKSMTLALRWLDLDRVFIDVRWHKCLSTAASSVHEGGIESTVAIFDSLSAEWGFGASASGPAQWMVVDTR